MIVKRNVTVTEKKFTAKNDDSVTARTCTEDGTLVAIQVYVNGWKAKSFKTHAGFERFLKCIGAVAVDPVQIFIDGPNYGTINM